MRPPSIPSIAAAWCSCLLTVGGCAKDESAPAPTPPILASDRDDLLRNAEQFTLLSLDPYPVFEDEEAVDEDGVFHGYAVLGTLNITDSNTRDRLLSALYQGIADDDPNEAIGCFNPRHGIRAERDGDTIELLICFECASLNLYENGRQIGNLGTTSGPESTFNDVLENAGVTLPDK